MRYPISEKVVKVFVVLPAELPSQSRQSSQDRDRRWTDLQERIDDLEGVEDKILPQSRKPIFLAEMKRSWGD